MTTKKIYGPWIKWHGGECPVPSDTKVGLRFRSGETETGYSADDYLWCQGLNNPDDIMEYCVAIEQADLEAAEQLLRDNGYTVTPPAKPLTFEDVVPMTEAPPEDTLYWVVSLSDPEGVTARYWTGSPFAGVLFKRRMAYLDKEHALIAARHIFGLKGGEL